MFIADYGSVRWGDPDHNSIIIRIKQENDPDYFECQIAENDPSPDLAHFYPGALAGDYGTIADYIAAPELPVTPELSSAPTLPSTGLNTPGVASPIVIDLWRVRTALRSIPPTAEFREMVTANNISIVDADGVAVEPANLSGLDQINFMMKVSEDAKLKDFWMFGNYVYDNSPNFEAFANILSLNADQLTALKNYAINIKI